MEELDDQQPVYEFFTIINDNDGTEELNEEQSNKVVYLTFCGDDEEASTSDVKTIENESDEFNELQTIDPNVKIIKLDNGEFYVTTTNSTDENLESINPILVNEETSIEEPNKDNVADLTDVDALNLDCKYEIVGLLDEPLMVYCDENTTNTTNEVVKEKKFKCYYEGCDKEYASPYQLNIHLRVHMDCKPYECTVEGCDKKFSTNYSLKAHIRTHTGEKPYGCVICYKHFKTSGDLQKHLRTHTGEKPFMCPIEGCGKSFTTSNIRKVHIRSHTGERPYTCNYPHCGKAFSSSTNYKNHVRIHSGEKPYVCQVDGCSKRFTEYSSLYKHNMVHQTSRPAVCRFCGQKFKHDSAMKLHKRVKHNVVLASDGTEIVVDLN